MSAKLISGFCCPGPMYASYHLPVVEWWKQDPSIGAFVRSLRGARVLIAHSAGGVLLAYAILFGFIDARDIDVVVVDSHLLSPRSGASGTVETFLAKTRSGIRIPIVERLQRDARAFIQNIARKWYRRASVVARPPPVRSWLQVQCSRTDYTSFSGYSVGNNRFLRDIVRLFHARIWVCPGAHHYQLVVDDEMRVFLRNFLATRLFRIHNRRHHGLHI